MKLSVRRICLLSLISATCFAQVELIQNNYPTDPQGRPYFPDSDVTYVSRAKNNAGVGIPGRPFQYRFKQYAGLGFHTHETSAGCCTITRPDPVWIPGTGQTTDSSKRLTGVTDASGYANAVLELNGYSGGYTICIDFLDPQTPAIVVNTSCVNHVTRYSTGYAGGGGVQYLQRYAGGLNPGANDTNQAQSLHWDRRHVCANVACVAGGTESAQQNSDGYTNRWGTYDMNTLLMSASIKYKQDTLVAGYSDLLDVTRISLPDGGVYDNDVQTVAPGLGLPATLNSSNADWNTRVYEEHARGVEADIIVASTQNQAREFAALYFYNCKPGINQPNGPPITQLDSNGKPDPYWAAQGVIHVSCIEPNYNYKGGIRAK